MKWTLALVAVVALALAWWFFLRDDSASASEAQFRTAKVERGEVIEGVQASGTVQPVQLVQVGTQISGVIEKLYADFNSKVTAGQTIAELDRRRLEAQIAQDEASVARAKSDVERVRAVVAQSKADIGKVTAAVTQAKADVDRLRALQTQAERDLARQQQLAERRLTAPVDLDAAVAAKGSLDAQVASALASVQQSEAQLASAQAAVQQNEAQLAVSEAGVKQAEAQLVGDRVNLGYATIVSPVDGVVVSRNVDVGQTVAASLSAPTLFLIANDLTKIQVQAAVPEADIGRIADGQTAHFSVDAHPERTFEGKVSQVRLASTTVQNVVTYTVLVDASNPDGLLLPGMTASVTFEITRSAKDALHVPSSALRLQAPPELVENPPAKETAAGPAAPRDGGTEGPATGTAAGGRRGPRTGGGGGAWRGQGGQAGGQGGWQGGGGRERRRASVYVLTPANRLRAIPVRPGISDGINTVVEPLEPGALTEGMEVVTAVIQSAEQAAATNPFAPPRMGGPSSRGGAGGGRR